MSEQCLRRHIVEARILMPVDWLLCRDRRRGVCSSDFCDVFIFPGGVAADSDGTDHFSFKLDWNAALQRSGPWQRQGRDPALAHLILKDFARPPENSCGPRFADAYFNACNLSIVQAFQDQHVTTIIYDHDHNSCATFLCFGLRGGCDLLRDLERQHFLRRQVPFDGSEEHKQKRKDS
jgi:hypothetical protein